MTFRLILAAAIALSACARQNPAAPVPQVPDSDGRIGFVISPNTGGPQQFVEVLAADIIQDTIVLDVRYGGGCAEHAFVLIGSGAFAESMPVQTSMRLDHDARGDNCRALVSRRLRADISPLRIEYQRSYQTQHGTIVIHVGRKQVRYVF